MENNMRYHLLASVPGLAFFAATALFGAALATPGFAQDNPRSNRYVEQPITPLPPVKDHAFVVPLPDGSAYGNASKNFGNGYNVRGEGVVTPGGGIGGTIYLTAPLPGG
jgi:hypothetical protein